MIKLLSLRLLLSAVAVGGIMSVGAYGTYSAWTDTTAAQASTLTAGTVHITNDASATSLFTVSGLIPGASLQKCINVTNAGDVPFTSVALTGAGTGLLAAALNITIDRGTGATGGAGGDCTGFSVGSTGIVSALANALPTAGSPVTETTGWSANATKSYRVTVTLNSSAASSLQGKTGDLSLTWTASS